MLSRDFEEVLQFWYPQEMVRDQASIERQYEWWFRGGSNDAIADRFVGLHDRAARGLLDHWAGSPRSRLALILVLDQFSRSLFPNSPRAYAQDAKALALSLEGIDIGHYDALATPWEKMFFFMPLGHSESLRNLEQVVGLAEALAQQARPEWKRVLDHGVSQARAHRDVIARYGRQPHRNPLLGRASTPEELDYIARGDFVHLRRVSFS